MRARGRGDRRGLSEIVGTLMLVLIVVGAAVAFSAFVASYQKQVQAEEQVAHNRALEDFRVLGMKITLNQTTTTNVALLNVSFANLDVQNSTISGISINGNPVRTYSAYIIDPQSGSSNLVPVPAGFELNVTPGAQVWAQINLQIGNTTPNASYSVFASNYVLTVSNHVTLDIYTALVNDFVQTFIPPTAVAFVSSIQSWDGATFVTVPLLDGSASIQTGNATIVSWSWAVTDDNSTAMTHPTTVYAGEKVALTATHPSDTYFANLTVTNGDGLVGVTSVPPFH